MSEQRQEQRLRSILNAAQARFARYGLEKVTMDEIAGDVGMGKASLYYYFPTKEAIFSAVIEKELGQYVERMAPFVKGPGSARERLFAYAGHRLGAVQELVNLNSMNLRSLFENNPLFKELFRGVAREDLQMMGAIVADGVAAGEFAVESPERAAELLLHVLQGLRIRALKHAAGMWADRDTEALQKETHEVLEMMMTGLQRKEPHA